MNPVIPQKYTVLGKEISMPVVYPKADAYMGLFWISTEKARLLINSDRIEPIRVWGNKSLLSVTVFDYSESPVDPYKEVAIAILTTLDAPFSPPFLPLVFNKVFGFGFYTLMLAMNTELARAHSEQIFGYPTYSKIIQVNITEAEGRKLIDVREGSQLIFSASCNPVQKYKRKRNVYDTLIKIDDKINLIKLTASADEAHSTNKEDFIVSIGAHPVSDIIEKLETDIVPARSIFYKNVTEVLDFPVDKGRA